MIKWAKEKKISAEQIHSFLDDNPEESSNLRDSFSNICNNADLFSHIAGDGRNKGNTQIVNSKEAVFFKSFNKSVFVIGVTIPNELREIFLSHLSIKQLECGIPHPVKIQIENHSFDAYILKANQKNGCYFWRIQWSKGSQIATFLQKRYHYIYSLLNDNANAVIPSDYGIWVRACEEPDVLEITCNSNDLPFPSSDIETKSFSLEEIPEDMRFSKPLVLQIESNVFHVTSWKALYSEICKWLYNRNKDVIEILLNESKVFETTKRVCFVDDSTKVYAASQIAPGIWAETCFSANNLLKLTKV